MNVPKCRLCGSDLTQTFVDLGCRRPARAISRRTSSTGRETFYPLNVRICSACLLVQLPAYLAAEDIFSRLRLLLLLLRLLAGHAQRYVRAMIARLGLGADSLVVEVASNDGYLLQHFVRRRHPVPRHRAGGQRRGGRPPEGIETVVRVLREGTGAAWRTSTAARPDAGQQRPRARARHQRLRRAACAPARAGRLRHHRVPAPAAADRGPTSSTRSTTSTTPTSRSSPSQRVFAEPGLTVVDVEELPTHGGSLRIWPTPVERAPERARGSRSARRRAGAGLQTVEAMRASPAGRSETSDDLLEFLIGPPGGARRSPGYGAPGKGNTLLNYSGIRTDFLALHRRPEPVQAGDVPAGHPHSDPPPGAAGRDPAGLLLILPWNLREEITDQLAYTREWGARLVVPLPTLEVC